MRLTLGNLGTAKGLFDDDVATCTTRSVTTMQRYGHDLPLGPRVTLTALARTSTPFRMLARPSLENLISLCAPRAKIVGRTAFAAALRAARDDEDEIACIVFLVRKEKDERKRLRSAKLSDQGKSGST